MTGACTETVPGHRRGRRARERESSANQSRRPCRSVERTLLYSGTWGFHAPLVRCLVVDVDLVVVSSRFSRRRARSRKGPPLPSSAPSPLFMIRRLLFPLLFRPPPRRAPPHGVGAQGSHRDRADGRRRRRGRRHGRAGVQLRPDSIVYFALDFGFDAIGGHDFNGDKRSEGSFTVNPCSSSTLRTSCRFISRGPRLRRGQR